MTGVAPDIEHVSQESREGTWLILKTPDYDTAVDGKQLSYLRLGSAGDDEPSLDAVIKEEEIRKSLLDDRSPPRVPSGWFEYTDGDRTIITVGAKREFIGKTYDLNVVDKTEDSLKYALSVNGDHKLEWGLVSSTECLFGDKESFFFGCQMDVTGGLGVSLDLCGKFGATLGIDVDVFWGYKIEVGRSYNFSFVEGDDLRVARNHAQEARENIHLSVKGMSETTRSRLRSVLGIDAAAIAAGATLVSTAFSTGFGAIDKGAGLGVGIGATGLYAIAMGFALCASLRAKKDNKDGKPLSELKMDKDGILLNHSKEDGQSLASLSLYQDAGKGRVDLRSTGYVELRSLSEAMLMLSPRGGAALYGPKTLSLRTPKANVFLNENGDLALRGRRVTIGGVLTINGDAYTPPPPPPPPPPQEPNGGGPRLQKRPQPLEWS